MFLLLALAVGGPALPAAEPKLPPGVVIEEQPKDPKAAKIVVIAGSNFYKPGEHEYLANCAVLSKLLVKARGVGLVQFHQSADYPKDFGPRARGWAGGCWEKGLSGRAHWITEFKDFPKHPITQGVEPFKIDDGWLFKLHFTEGLKGITPLLRTDDPKAKAKPKPEESTVAWAYEREAGRSFTFTGGHLHASFHQPGYRKFLVNGVLWSAGMDVPQDGANVAIDAKEIDAVLAPKK
jgi:hypothetical protein